MGPEETMIAAPLTSGSHPGSNVPGRRQEDDVNIVAFETRYARNGRGAPDEVVPPLKAQSGSSGKGDGAPMVAGTGVRRLTPVECERLQGFPDNWTRLDDNTPDGHRYAALGNAVTVPVAEWIGRRLARVVNA